MNRESSGAAESEQHLRKSVLRRGEGWNEEILYNGHCRLPLQTSDCTRRRLAIQQDTVTWFLALPYAWEGNTVRVLTQERSDLS